MKQPVILSIDQGTSGSKAILFSLEGDILASCTEDYEILYPNKAYVEIDPQTLLQSVYIAVKGAIHSFEEAGGNRNQIQTIGISNQRESFLIWEASGKTLSPVVVWQCRRSADFCLNITTDNELLEHIRYSTGLLPDPYFSGTKAAVLVNENSDIRDAVKRGSAMFGTIDTWLAWNFTNSKIYATDRTNASRTMLFDINTLEWDQTLIEGFGLKGMQFPEVRSSDAGFGTTDLGGLLGTPVPVGSMIGDSHAAAFGEGLFSKGESKVTLGTGSSILMNVGKKRIESENGMVSTLCWSAGDRTDYALEGIIVSCGSTINWLKDNLKLISSNREIDELAEEIDDADGLYFIPGFSGIGAPWWKPDAKASIVGMDFGHDRRHVARAALESIPFQVCDVLSAMSADFGHKLTTIKADGGITVSDFVLRSLSSLTECPVQVPSMKQASAWGAALLAGLNTGLYTDLEKIRSLIRSKQSVEISESADPKLNKRYQGWRALLQDY